MEWKILKGIFATGSGLTAADWLAFGTGFLGFVGAVLMVAAGVVSLQVKLLEKKQIMKALDEGQEK